MLPAILTILANAAPLLKEYFTKNYGINSTTTSFVSPLLAIVAQALMSGGTDQVITALQNQGEYGLIAGAALAGLRLAITVYKASKAA